MTLTYDLLSGAPGPNLERLARFLGVEGDAVNGRAKLIRCVLGVVELHAEEDHAKKRTEESLKALRRARSQWHIARTLERLGV